MSALAADEVVIALDVGGTKTAAAVIDTHGRSLFETQAPTKNQTGPDGASQVDSGLDDSGPDDLDRVAGVVVQVLDHWRTQLPQVRIAALGAGFCEYVDPLGQLTSHEVISWSRQPQCRLKGVLADHGLGEIAVSVDSDVRLAALGEARYGAGRGLGSFIFVGVGTGLSSTLVVDGRPWAGAHGRAIALGEWLVPGVEAGAGLGDGPITLEAWASGAGLRARYHAAHPDSPLDVPDLCELAATGEGDSWEIMRSAGTALGTALAEFALVLEPEAVILGGGLGSADTPLRTVAEQVFAQRLERQDSHPAPQFLVAQCGGRSGLMGAAALALDSTS